MEVSKLNAKVREKSGGSTCRTLRKTHRIPGVVYGKNTENLLVEFSEMELNNVLKNYGENAVVNLDINGSTKKTMIKEVQRNPIDRSLTHIDMKYVDDDEKIHADIPIVIKGENFVRSKGGIVQKQLGTVSIETTPDKVPKHLIADVSNLSIGDKFTVADIEFSSDISVASDFRSVIATITTSKEKEIALDEGEEQALDDSIQKNR